VAYLGWAAYAALFVFRPQDITSSEIPRGPFFTTLISILVLLIFWGAFAIQKLPWTFYVYVAFPCYFWNQVILHGVRSTRSWVGAHRYGFYGRSFLQATLVIGILESMVVRNGRLQWFFSSQYKF
jgi:phosphatidylinositol glycan class N